MNKKIYLSIQCFHLINNNDHNSNNNNDNNNNNNNNDNNNNNNNNNNNKFYFDSINLQWFLCLRAKKKIVINYIYLIKTALKKNNKRTAVTRVNFM